ncbi:response regulator [Marinobacter goseongensis]|nr:response regulator [Marinobacter goseongensis]
MASVVWEQLASLAKMDATETLREAHKRLRQVSYDLILLDLKLEDGDGLSLWETIHGSQPNVPAVILSQYEVPRTSAPKVAALVQKAPVTAREIEIWVLGLLSGRTK